MSIRRAGTFVATTLLVVSACTGAGPDDTTAPPTADDSAAPTSSVIEMPCDEPVVPEAELPDGYATIANAVALPTADSAERALQTSRREGAPAPNYFAKTGLLVRAGIAFTIEVNGAAATALIGWGRPPNFGAALTTEGCAGEGWQAFPGGFWVDEPRCLEVTVRTGGGEETVQVGVGAPCEGQKPPPEPTDP